MDNLSDFINDLEHLRFQSPEFLFLLALIPIIFLLNAFVWKSKRPTLKFTEVDGLRGGRFLPFLNAALPILKYLALGLLIVAVARPQSTKAGKKEKRTEGIDIAIAMDVSSSMLAMDFKPNRLEAAKEVAQEFIDGRPNDRFSLVIYAGECFTQVPLTSDSKLIGDALAKIKNGLLEDGTAIGLGLATAVNRLKDSKAKSKIIILLTDGVNNQGSIDPITAAELAKEFSIKVYTIGVGTIGKANYPATDFFGKRTMVPMDVRIDEELLTEIADLTSAKYFRATNKSKLAQVYEEIDKLEKTQLEELQFIDFEDLYRPFAILALMLLGLEYLLRYTLLKGIF